MKIKMIGMGFIVAGAALLVAQLGAQNPPGGQAAGAAAPAGAQSGGPRGRGGAGGTISSVGVDQFVVQRPDGSSLTVQVDDQTRFSDQGKAIQLEDLKAGDHVMVRARAPEGGAESAGPAAATGPITAAEVRRVPPSAVNAFSGERAFGQITAINGNQLTVQNQQGEKVIVVSNDTVIRRDRQPATLQDFKVGDRVMAMGKETNGQFVATRLMAGHFGPHAGPAGTPGGPPPPNR